MSFEQAMIAAAKPHILLLRNQRIWDLEVSKGCEKRILSQPVALEPVFRPLESTYGPDLVEGASNWVIEEPPCEDELVRLRVWVADDQPWDWGRSESWLKLLTNVKHRVVFEIAGNRDSINVDVLCHRDDAACVEFAFIAKFELSELSPAGSSPLSDVSSDSWNRALFCDMFPSPPYSHLFTSPEELERSPLEALMRVLSRLPDPTLGVYQVVFQPVSQLHNWHRNVQAIYALEYMRKLLDGANDVRRFAQQDPDSDLRQMAMNLASKAHNDKPFFAAALRMAVLNAGERSQEAMGAIGMFAGLIQHGGLQLQVMTETDYRKVVPPSATRLMFVNGASYRVGFLLNSWELTSMLHVPPPKRGRRRTRIKWESLETLPPDPELHEGSPLGFCMYAGDTLPVCVPFARRVKHVHLMGKPGCGKTSVLEAMILDDIARGDGVAVIDPHGDLIRRLLAFTPREAVERVVYINPGDPDWIPLWNPLNCARDHDPGEAADDLVSVFKTFVDGWGDRLEHILRNTLYGALTTPGNSLLDVAGLFRTSNPENYDFRDRVLQAVDNKSARDFWEHDFAKYSKDDFSPPRNKLSKLLLAGGVSLMLSQPTSAVDLRKIMDEGRILYFNLAEVGSQVRDILGSLLISLLCLETTRRSRVAPDRRGEYHLYCDEVHRFMTDSLEDIITQARKYNVSMALAHQSLSQFNRTRRDALSNVGTTIMFNPGREDAQRFTKDLRGLVDVDDLIGLDDWQAIGRIGKHVVRFRTNEPPKKPEYDSTEAIIRHSREHYYRRAADVRREIAERYGFGDMVGRRRPAEPDPPAPVFDVF